MTILTKKIQKTAKIDCRMILADILNKESSEKTHSIRAAHQGSVVLGIVIEFNSLDNKY